MLDSFVERQTRTLRGNQVLIALRLLLATISLTILIIQEFQNVAKLHAITPAVPAPPESVQPLYSSPPGLVAIIVCGLTILYVLVARQSEKNPRVSFKLAFVQIFVDIFLISVLIWHSGGVDSQFVVLYLISICAAAFVLKWNVAVLAAAASTVLFSLVTLLYSIGWIPDTFRAQSTAVQVGHLHNLTFLDFVRLLLLPVCAFFLTAFLSGTLSRRLAMARLLHDEILEGIGEGIVVLDTDLREQYHNGEFRRLMGPTADLKQNSIAEVLGAEVDSAAREVLQDAVSRRIESRVKRADKTVLPLAIRIIPLRELDAEQVRGVILALDDITAEKKMEEFARHRQRIETMGHISATIAHEIRNPLASIRGAVQEIGRDYQVSEGKKILIDIAMSETDRLDQIITDFLRFARMRMPKFIVMDVGRILADVKLLLAARAEARDVKITLTGDEGDPFPVDPEQLRQLFLNLGVNALQAMEGCDRKEISIRIEVRSLHDAMSSNLAQVAERVDRPGVMIEFSDTGKGMSEDIARQIFEPFYTTKATGTGLGLAIVERIVQGHEGVITVASKEGQGSTFYIWLPSDLKVGATLSGALPAVALS